MRHELDLQVGMHALPVGSRLTSLTAWQGKIIHQVTNTLIEVLSSRRR